MGHESRLLCAFGFNGSAGKEQVADESVADLAPQARNAPEARDQAKPQLRKTEAGHLVGNDQIAAQRQFEPAAHAQAMHRGDGNKGRRVDRIQHLVDSLQEAPHTGGALAFRQRPCSFVQFFQVRAGAKSAGTGTGDDASAGDGCQRFELRDKFLEVFEHDRADFIEWLAVQRHFQHALAPLPSKRPSAKFLHHAFPPAAAACFRYMCSISSWNLELMASRRSLPLAVSKPLSGVNASLMIEKFRTWR